MTTIKYSKNKRGGTARAPWSTGYVKPVYVIERELKNLSKNWTGSYQQRRKYAELKSDLPLAKERERLIAEERAKEPERKGPRLLEDLGWLREDWDGYRDE
tara:strand:- start:36 stop:338 length:303 start_codon:yes stop_codon:yes gene_type:complete